jgi:hypothetical protein
MQKEDLKMKMQKAEYQPDVDGRGVCVFVGEKRIAKLENGKWVVLEPGYEMKRGYYTGLAVFFNGVQVASFYA